MSVLIKGMKMPKSCSECGFEHRAYCFLVDTVIESNGRPDWCPLAEVSEKAVSPCEECPFIKAEEGEAHEHTD